jgi:transposase
LRYFAEVIMLWLAQARRPGMKVMWKNPGDADCLSALMASETRALQRDRFRAVLLAGHGLGDRKELERAEIAAIVGRSRQFIDEWVGRYRRQGVVGLYAKKQPGAVSRLTPEQAQEFLQWLEQGPTPEENLAAYNGPILREKLQARFGKLYSLNGVYALLHRLGYNDLMPRTTHPDTDPAVIESFKKKSSPRRWQRSRPPTQANAS